MKMDDEISLPVPKATAWTGLNDVELLKACLPGCEAITLQGDGSYEVLISAAVGPIRAKFKGEMRMLDVVAPTSYRLEFSMQGGAVGFGKGSAQVELVEVDADNTLLKYTAIANVGGKLAQVGARLIDITAKKMAGEFFAKFCKELLKRQNPEQVVEGVPPVQGVASRPQAAARDEVTEAAVSRVEVNRQPAAPVPAPASEGTVILKIEITLIDQTGGGQKSRLARWLQSLFGR